MLIDSTHREETRVAVVEGNKLLDFDFEIAHRKQLKGNIYLAKVTRVEPSLQACFVDYGGNRHGFLPFPEIHADYYKIPVADKEALLAEQAQMEAPAHSDGDDDGDEGGEATAVGGDDVDEAQRRRKKFIPPRYKIQEVIKRRQILLVQVSKEERGNKGAALTTYLSLPGRYCVLMPNSPRGGGVSRKISNPKDRKKMKEILSDIEVPDGMSVILRTAGLERTRTEIKRDLDYLLRLWDEIRELTMRSVAPELIYEEGDLVKRAIRDLYNRDIEEVLVAGDDGYKAAKGFMKMLMPSHARRVQPYKEADIPMFFRYNVENQVDAMHDPVVQLKSGGYLVINPTEALISVDVNSGRSTKERNIEETALKTNLEAAEELARQLRLRDLGGLVVIDFIDMEDPRNDAAVERRMKEAMRIDRARIQIGRISNFGLMELSRQRLRPSLMETSFQTCPHCGGTGRIRSTESAALAVLRAIEEEGIKRRSAQAVVHVATDIALYILNNKRRTVARIEDSYGLSVQLTADPTLVPPEFRMHRSGRPSEVVASGVVSMGEDDPDLSDDIEAEDEDIDAEEASGEDDEGGSSRLSRRKRRPRRRKKRDPESQGEARDAAEAAEAGPADESGSPEAPHEDGNEAARSKRRRGRRGGRRRRRDDERQPDGAQADADSGTAAEGEAEAEPVPETSADEDASTQLAERAEPVAEASEPPEPPEAAPPADVTQPDQAAADGPADAPKKRTRRPRKPKAELADAPADPVEAAPPGEAAEHPAPAPEPQPEPEPVPEPEPEPEPENGVSAAEARAERERQLEEEKAAARAAEIINQTPEKPKSGWWNRLKDKVGGGE